MKSQILSVLVLSVFALTVSAQCGRTCRFRFCRADGSDPPSQRPKGTRTILRGPDSSRSGFICRNFRNGRTLGTIRSTGTALIETGASTTPINKWSPAGLNRSFPRNYFRLYNILFLKGLQGIGRRPSRGNQEDFLDDICVRLPIIDYDILRTDRSVFRTVSTSNPRDCVSFRTINRPILVEVAWDSSDDFDLSVEGPPGSDGQRLRDNLVANCGGPPAGKETVTYRNIIPGTYTIRLFHFNNCFNRRTRWRVNAIVRGKRVLQRTGRSSVDSRQVLELSFTVWEVKEGWGQWCLVDIYYNMLLIQGDHIERRMIGANVIWSLIYVACIEKYGIYFHSGWFKVKDTWKQYALWRLALSHPIRIMNNIRKVSSWIYERMLGQTLLCIYSFF